MIRALFLSTLLIFGQSATAPGRHTGAKAVNGGASITAVAGASNGALVVTTNAVTLTTTSTGSGHFLIAGISCPNCNNFGGMTVQPSGTAMVCNVNSGGSGSAVLFNLCYLANAPASQTSIVAAYTSSNTQPAAMVYEEYAGMSTTATQVNTPILCLDTAGFTTATSTTCGPYTATGANLVWNYCYAGQNGTSVTPPTGWTSRQVSASGTGIVDWLFDQLGPSAGSYTGGTSSYPGMSPGGGHYNCVTGSYL